MTTTQIFNTIIALSTFASAIGTLTVTLKKIHGFMNAQEEVVKDMKRVKQEQKLVYTGLCACLDGLEQLGCNHTVPKAKRKLENFINEQAHE